jgi:two-component system chemotaxis sensor kinase CheA
VTARVARERSEASQREMLAVFRRLLADRNAFGEFIDECGALVDAIASGEGDLVTLKRRVHTLKGNTAIYGVETVAKLCHELETGVLGGEENPAPSAFGELKTLWSGLLARCAELGWQRDSTAVQIEYSDVRELLASVRAGAPQAEIARTVAGWALEPASLRLKRIGEQIESLAPRRGKPVPSLELAPTKLRISTKKWAPILSSLAHVVRNIVDHGLETADERVAAGKPLPGRVMLSFAQEDAGVVLTLADDGRGVDWEKVRIRARTAGLPHTTRRELEEALFVDEITTTDKVTMTSGRGVGLAAVRAAASAAGGHIEVSSEPGKGTTFRVVLPESMLAAEELGFGASMLPPSRVRATPSQRPTGPPPAVPT